MDSPISFGLWLKEQRIRLDLTQADLANCVGCSVVTIRKIEADERRPSRQIAQLLAQCLHLPAEQHNLFLQVARGERRVDRLGLAAPWPEAERRPAVSLPRPLTPLLGREHELAAMAQLLHDPACRLLTLVGPGGIGKTRLALEAAFQLGPTFSDGAAFVSLAGVQAAEFIAPTIADALGLAFSGPTGPKTQLLNHLRPKQALLVLDNLEHLLAGVELLSEILAQSPGVKLLATSREQLNLQMEWVFQVQGLPVPGGEQPIEGETGSAAALFLHRARQAHTEFVLTAGEWPAVLRICRLVEGLPLALELAAAWVRTLSCAEIAREIERSLDFLTTSKRDIPERHRSIRAVLDYSWALLSPEEQQGLRQLSVFRSGFRREAAEQVAGAGLSLLSALINKSLVRRSQAGRYDLHELTRQYAEAKLDAEGQEEQTVRNRHAAYYLNLLAESQADLRSRRQKDVLAALNAEIDNIRQAWEFALTWRQLDLIRRAVWPLWYFYELRNYCQEGEALFGRAAGQVQGWLAALDPAGSAPARQQAEAVLGALLSHQGYCCFRQGRNREAAALYQASIALLRPPDLNEQTTLTYTLARQGGVRWYMGEFEESARCFREGILLSRALKLNWQELVYSASLGAVLHEQGHYDEAYGRLSEAMAGARQMGDPRLIAYIGSYLSRTAQTLGRKEEVQALLAEGLRLATETGDRFSIGIMLERMAAAAQAGQDQTEAYNLLVKTVELYREIDDRWSLSRALNLLGQLSLKLDQVEQAQEYFKEAFNLAVAAQVMPNALNALAGLAALALEANNNLAALELVNYILEHPASPQETKDYAGQLLGLAEARLSQAQAVRAQMQAKAFNITELMQTAMRLCERLGFTRASQLDFNPVEDAPAQGDQLGPGE